jgi:glycosyltransferase involved in cell wall biosynthesis
MSTSALKLSVATAPAVHDRVREPISGVPRVLLLIPAFNEEQTLGELLIAAQTCVQDILVIDDGSVDATSAIARNAGAMVYRLPANLGKGEALKTGFAYALEHNYDHVITMDADGQHDPRDIAHLLPLADRYDLILGNRMEESRSVPLIRRLANRTSSRIVSILCGRHIFDSQTGFRSYSAVLLRELSLNSSRFDLETEVVIKAARRGLRIGHCKVRTIYRDQKSRFRNVGDSIKFAIVVLKSFWY